MSGLNFSDLGNLTMFLIEHFGENATFDLLGPFLGLFNLSLEYVDNQTGLGYMM
jgi:hypothetical protein